MMLVSLVKSVSYSSYVLLAESHTHTMFLQLVRVAALDLLVVWCLGKVVWRFVRMRPGERSAMTFGLQKMQQ